MKILVIGNSVEETIVRAETGEIRKHIGGVGAIMARELALSGGATAEVTFLTTTAPGQPALNILQAMEAAGVNTHIVNGHPPQTRKAQARITTRNGGPVSANGDWPPMPSLSPHIESMAPEHDWTIVTANLTAHDLRTAETSSPNLAVNATSKHHVKRIPMLKRPTVATMNNMEASALVKAMKTSSGTALRQALHADTLMVTLGAKGRIIHRQDMPSQVTEAPPAPENTDFIGAGDAATAGLVLALACNLDLKATVDSFITQLMERNAQAYTQDPKPASAASRNRLP